MERRPAVTHGTDELSESSAVSLRDVRRCLLLVGWFDGPGNAHNMAEFGVQGSPKKLLMWLDHRQFAAEYDQEYPYAAITLGSRAPGRTCGDKKGVLLLTAVGGLQNENISWYPIGVSSRSL
jgi:hypothetical protein